MTTWFEAAGFLGDRRETCDWFTFPDSTNHNFFCMFEMNFKMVAIDSISN